MAGGLAGFSKASVVFFDVWVEDRHVFRVPSLRVVTRTAPYFHDGSIQTLDQAVRLMARYQLGCDLPERDVALIGRFLATLVDGSRDNHLASTP